MAASYRPSTNYLHICKKDDRIDMRITFFICIIQLIALTIYFIFNLSKFGSIFKGFILKSIVAIMVINFIRTMSSAFLGFTFA